MGWDYYKEFMLRKYRGGAIGMNPGEGWLVVREGFNQEVTFESCVLKAL